VKVGKRVDGAGRGMFVPEPAPVMMAVLPASETAIGLED